MSVIAPRRAFLKGLTSLPLIGGGVTLIGQPTAVAEPVTVDLLEAYKSWLDMEHRFLAWDMAADPMFARYRGDDRVARSEAIRGFYWQRGDVGGFHGGSQPSPYTRAALVMSTVGCDWRERD